MNQRFLRSSLLTAILIPMILFSGCRLDTLNELSWNSEWILPFATSESGLNDIIQDSTLEVNQQGVFALVFRDTLTRILLDDLIEFPEIDQTFSVRLDSIRLNPDTISQQVTLGQLATQLAADGNILGQIILNNHNNTLPLVPSISGLSSGTIPIDASSFFDYALLDSGFMDLSIVNEFPLTLENVILEIRNANIPGSPIVRDTFPDIPSKSSRTRSYDLSGKEIGSELIGELINLNLRDSVNVPIDTSEYIEVVIVARDLKALEANAVFPAQTVLEQSRTAPYTFGTGNQQVRITEMIVLSGTLETQSITTIEDSLFTVYEIVNATNTLGESPSVALKILPAPPNGVRNQTASQNLEGFFIDMSLGGTTWSKLQDYFRAELLYSGKLVTMDQEDSLNLTFRVKDLRPTFAKGYFGSESYEFEGDVSVKWRDGLNVGRIRFADPKARLVIQSSLGVDVDMEIVDLTARSSRSGNTARLSTGALLAGPLTIERPTLPDTFGIAETILTFDQTESNLVQILDMEADELRYRFRLHTNPDRNPNNFDDFATNQSEIMAVVDLEVPLDGVLETLVIEDTVLLNPSPAQDIPAERGIIRMLLDNDFPLLGVASVVVQDQAGASLFTIADQSRIEAGIPLASGRTEEATRTILEIPITKEQLEGILEKGTRVVIRYELDTRPANGDVKFYEDYRLQATITVQFPLSPNG